MTDPTPSDLGRAIQEVTEKLQLLVREEIALAQAEIQQKLAKLIRGIVAGALAAVFGVFGLVYLLDAASWGIWDLTGSDDNFWLGFLVTALVFPVATTWGTREWSHGTGAPTSAWLPWRHSLSGPRPP